MKRLTILISALLCLPFQIANGQVGQAFELNIINPVAFIQAMDTLNASASGQANNPQVFLRASLANGEMDSTHNVAVVYDSFSSMDVNRTRNATSQDWANFLSIVNDISTPVAEYVFSSTGIDSGNASVVTSANPYILFIQLRVDDPTAYAAASRKLMGSGNNSNIYAHLYQIRGGGPNGPSHVVTQTANSLDDLLGAAPNPGFDEFLEEVSGIRTVLGTGVYQQVMAWE